MFKHKKDVLFLVSLFLFPVFFAFFSEWVVIDNDMIKKLVYLFVGFVVITTIYIILSSIFKKNPHFLSRGIWGNKFFTFLVGAILLSLLIGVYILLFNSISVNSFLNRFLTLFLAYPVLFVLILMIHSFISNVFVDAKNNILLISSYSILVVQAIFMLL